MNRPILLSVGYAACHWCHVMAHESFEDPETAAVMNRLFVNIKVDREERPDIDHIYMTALRALGEQGGWPLTMFLTPEGDPIWGGTYFPNAAKYGRPAFTEVLASVAETFASHPERIEANRAALHDYLNALPPTATRGPTPAMLDEAADLVAGLFDPVNGGLQGAPKFPQPSILEFVWRSADRADNADWRNHVLYTLRRMSEGGIYDHIGGGLARYSVDERWLVPHFEKMLYDNALFISRLTSAWRLTGEDLFRRRIEETAGWLLRAMSVGEAFAASIDADSEGGEGAFYVWRPEEVDAVLGSQAGARFCALYDITEAGNFEGRSIPNRLSTGESAEPHGESQLAAWRELLRSARANRPAPARDDKILADWNGLAIAALAEAGSTLRDPAWIDAGVAAFRFISESMQAGGRLRHSFKDGILLEVGFAGDYAAMIRAAISLHQATFDPAYLDTARGLAESLDRHHWDPEIAAYRMTADDADALVARPVPLADESVPGANGMLAMDLTRLASLTGEQRFRDRAEQIVTAHCGDARSVLGKASLFSAADQQMNGVDVVLVVPPGKDAGALVRVARANKREAHLHLVAASPASLPKGHPAAEKDAVDNRPTAYVCRGQTCSLPVTDPDALTALLASQRRPGRPSFPPES